ncbi:MAG TPA: adenosylcobinamide-GDP ribazoletransferase [Pseudomonadales bacterium]|nr:adenosylcobinamide-GDP ribazoletransferase [Pseudomonadales bacterium]
MLKRELEYFFAAVRFFTRLPVPAWVGHSAEQLDHATRYFPLMGIIVGSIGASVTLMASLLLPVSIAIILGMVATLLATGAFHEDGLADAVDGFGGGWTVLRILDIMKDSRVGSYGAIAMTLMLLGKFSALLEIGMHQGVMLLCLALVAGHAVSRLASTSLLYFLAYVREDALSKSKPLGKQISPGELLVASIVGLAPVLYLAHLWPDSRALASAMVLVVAVTLYVGRYFRKHIGGYTGDCLGATQQIAEVSFYIGLLCKFS